MKAVVYKGPFDVAVEQVPDPTIQHPNDVIVKITSSNCTLYNRIPIKMALIIIPTQNRQLILLM